MRKWVLVIVCLAASLPVYGKKIPSDSKALPKDPRAILAAAAPFYDFANPTVKPWHFLASYQLYDDDGKPSEAGTFEYWWASPSVYRTTWTRVGATRTDWHTADGVHLFVATSEDPGYFEYVLPSALLSALPNLEELQAAKIGLERKVISVSHLKLPCVLEIQPNTDQREMPVEPLVNAPTFCFEPEKPILRISSSGVAVAEYNDVAMVRGAYLARSLVFESAGHKILSATVKEVTGLSPSDAALKPSARAKPVADELMVTWNTTPISSGGTLTKHVWPLYPPGAKQLGQSGSVLLQARIGTDGSVRNEQVVVSDSPLLNTSALKAVSQWVYKPYVVNGKPVEAEILIKVMFSLGR